MDKSWIKKSRWTYEYYKGANDFVDFAFENASEDGRISCPCMKCTNSYSWTREVVRDHLICNGISPNYDNWFFYGEPISRDRSNPTNESSSFPVHNVNDNIRGMLSEAFQMHNNKLPDDFQDDSDFQDSPGEGFDSHQPKGAPNEDASKFYKLLKDAEQPLYNGCEKYSKLAAIIVLYHLKSLHGWSNKSFSMLLEVLKDMLPSDSKLPDDCYAAKKYIKDLGLGYEKIHACPNNCILFWKDNAAAEVCPKCSTSRWKTNEGNVNQDAEEKSKKKKPAKVLRWFPLKQRLQRLFMSSKTASMMKWHAEGRTDDGLMRHPADSLAWKSFDRRYADFSLDPRNVRLGLATDGFNPFRTMSTKYSCWPVILIPYNLPPWVCMKRSSFILSLLIPGPNSPSVNIDVYLQPLIEELVQLWDLGLDTYDASVGENFRMRAALLWTINDFPAYGDLSGWSTKGPLSCPCCNYDTRSRWLKYGGKYCFMGHRRFLHKNHRFRKDRISFDGTQEKELAPEMLSGTEILEHTQYVECNFGKQINMSNGKRKRNENTEYQPWKKKSIFFMLSYWEHHLLRHNLDVMHIEKNVCDNVLGTLLSFDGKSKDNLKARLDLKDMGLRPELHPQSVGLNKVILPTSCFTMSLKEKDQFLKILKNVKVPDGYSSNLSRCIQLKERKMIGLKSHDCHVLMQQLLPIALRGVLSKRVVAPLIDLCCFFRELCSKTLDVRELEQLESRIVETLCHLEMIFPPSFFTIMVHLVVHLATEAKIAGPVHYRWMYPIERLGLS